ncbi:cell division inhibitor SepF [Catenibacillus scindens]|uniref:Cell division protein SepF n=1 Tax=Catenibacillus scindens TaxID=673271 RepID=A0A7W8H9L8_9FIRM|nr:cell division protein SepF [Catenibacillus scindens]MBB5263675.1 cell division inhibitor SepF [Catenibacillus scindens]
MGKGLDKFLNMMRLNDDNYDDDYDDEYADDYNDYTDDYDEYDDDVEEEPAPKKKKTTFRSHTKTSSSSESSSRDYSSSAASTAPSMGPSSRTSAARSSKIVPMKQPSVRGAGMEVSIQKPSSFEDSSEICDVLLTGKAAVVNLEGIDVEVAQRIIDFVSGACYAMSGNIQKVSSYIFIVTPSGIDISGDMENVLTGNGASKVDMSAFRLNV